MQSNRRFRIPRNLLNQFSAAHFSKRKNGSSKFGSFRAFPLFFSYEKLTQKKARLSQFLRVGSGGPRSASVFMSLLDCWLMIQPIGQAQLATTIPRPTSWACQRRPTSHASPYPLILGTKKEPQKTCPLILGTKKEPQSQKIARTAPKSFLNNSRGIPVLTHKNKGFKANRTRKFTRKFGEIFAAKVLWGTFSVPDNKGVGARRTLRLGDWLLYTSSAGRCCHFWQFSAIGV